MRAHIEPTKASWDPPAGSAGGAGLLGSSDNSDDSRSATWKAIGLVIAGITAVTPIGLAVIDKLGGEVSGPRIIASSMGSIGNVTPNEDATEVTVAGTAFPGVDAVVVTIDSSESGGQRFVAEAEVFAQEWKLVIPTEPKLASGYEIKANFYSAPNVSLAASHQVLASSFEDPPAPPPPPGQIVDCVVLHGDSCFQNQPGWSDPSIYRSDQ